jgi:hypothetical protein
MITTTTAATCISVIHDICSCKSHNNMITTKMAPCISVNSNEIQEAVVFVIIWWCDLQLHMSCITEIQGAVVIVIIWWCDLQLHMAYIISVIYDICRCKSNHHMFTITTTPYISVIYDICSCKSRCDLLLHMAYITEIQEFVVVVMIWWCDLQLHMSYITEIQEAVVVVIIWWCDIQLHMACITEIQVAITPPFDHDHDGLLYFSNI